MKLLETVSIQAPKAQRRATEILTKCPSCGSRDLIRVDEEILCGTCSWDSCEASVRAGNMDDFFNQAFRHFERQSENAHALPSQDPIEIKEESLIA